jgi:hypothetical protein
MRRAAPGVVLLTLVAFLIVVLAPVVLAGAMAPQVTLKGPGDAALNQKASLSGTVLNTNGGEGAMYVVIQQKINSAWKVIAKTKPRWTDSDTGAYAVSITVKNPAMSLCRYRAVWEAGGVKGYSKTLIIAVQ